MLRRLIAKLMPGWAVVWIRYFDGSTEQRLVRRSAYGWHGYATSRVLKLGAFTCNSDGTTSGASYVKHWRFDD